ncbi:hypothetical protein [Streptomyces jumonjinensis]|uniref:Uncharacterized protein n=1 Tax=Streptomyces jumonjinensis TaxID=1945 RepID=A0A646KLH6_STRJU|nr:hypothetical protein [Streptomyces jumonjinensis]MQT03162.1 hypothetical protein [Streptomyces jumonjinensis]
MDLLSKWGFNDGVPPDDWYDYCDRHGIDPNQVEYPLVTLVRKYLVPLIDQAITVVDIETNHNPIRADSIDGTDVIHLWRESKSAVPRLTPETVDVPMTDALRIALTESGVTPKRY